MRYERHIWIYDEYGQEGAFAGSSGRSGILESNLRRPCTGLRPGGTVRPGLPCGAFFGPFPRRCAILHLDGADAVVDALLYNRDEIETALELAPGCCLSDEGLLLKLVLQKGWKALAVVNGDFAGAVLDREKGSWTLFRDHLGVRPFYYYMENDVFVFSTDIRGIAAVPGIELRPNEKRIFAKLHFCNTLSLRETDYANVWCIRPGAVTVIEDRGAGFTLREKPY